MATAFKVTPLLWVRAGDADGYNSFDDIDEVADYLNDYGVSSALRFCNKYGVCESHRNAFFRGNNYISLYYADQAETPLRGLQHAELRRLNQLLREARAYAERSV